MSLAKPSIQKLLVQLAMAPQESGMLERSLKALDLDIDSVSTFLEVTLKKQRELVREQQVLRQVQDLASAMEGQS